MKDGKHTLSLFTQAMKYTVELLKFKVAGTNVMDFDLIKEERFMHWEDRKYNNRKCII